MAGHKIFENGQFREYQPRELEIDEEREGYESLLELIWQRRLEIRAQIDQLEKDHAALVTTEAVVREFMPKRRYKRLVA